MSLHVPSVSRIGVEISEIVAHESSAQADKCAVVRSQVHELPSERSFQLKCQLISTFAANCHIDVDISRKRCT